MRVGLDLLCLASVFYDVRLVPEPYELVKLANGVLSLREIANGETYHPVAGPMREALDLHVAGCRLLERSRQTGRGLVVWDVGLGAAANAIAALETGPAEMEIHSFDCTTAPARFALVQADALGYLRPWVTALERVVGGEEWISADAAKRWRLHLGDFAETMSDVSIPAPDAIFWDLYSPDTLPGIWSLEIFERLFRRLDPGCLLTSYSRSSAVRVTLLLAGFFVGRLAGVAEKDEMTVAANDVRLLERPLGRDWLDRVRRSTNAAPLRNGVLRPCPIAESDFSRLQSHPQFAERP